jgi:hypothetical protein
MSITPVYLLIKILDFPCYAGLPSLPLARFVQMAWTLLRRYLLAKDPTVTSDALGD